MTHFPNNITDKDYMLRCLSLAKKGLGFVSPNPMVGAVLVFENKIIGEGWHQNCGEAHAEVNCIHSVEKKNKALIAQSTLYVSLEPCAHYGKTPPCTDIILQHKIPKVFIGCMDSFSKVAGKGIELLRNLGVEVITPFLEKESRLLNKRFFTVQEKGRPYIILKWAQSSDGYLAPLDGRRTQLSNASSRKLVHKMRYEEDAILIGYQTAFNDDPQLNNRLWKSHGKQPIRIVLDGQCQLPPHLNIFDQSQQTFIFNLKENKTSGKNQWIKINEGQPIIEQILSQLGSIQSLIVEGGAKTLQLFLDEEIWDEALIFKTPVNLGNGIPAPLLRKSKCVHRFHLEEDIVNLHVHERNTFYL